MNVNEWNGKKYLHDVKGVIPRGDGQVEWKIRSFTE
jgi:hypothetical protein